VNKFNYIFVLVVLGLAGTFVFNFSPARATIIEARREELDDTAFIEWLVDFKPDTKELKLERWEIISGSDRVEETDRLEYYREWTNFTGDINRPVDQIARAVRAGKEELMDEWLAEWLEAPAVDRSQLNDVIDLLLENRKLDRARRVIERGRQMFDNEHLYYRRLAANYYARGSHREAIEEYLRVARSRRLTSRLKHRLQLIINQAEMQEFFINKILAEAEDMDEPEGLILMAVDLTARADTPAEMLPKLLDISGDTDFVVAQLENIRERFLRINNPGLAGSVHRRLGELADFDGDYYLTKAKINLKLQQPDTALETLAELQRNEIDRPAEEKIHRLKIRAYLFNNSYDSAAELLENYPDPDKMLDEKIELLQVKNSYETLAQLAEDSSEELPWVEFYSAFMQGDIDTAALEELVRDQPDQPVTALALALSAVQNPEPARDFLAWLDQFPFDKKIEMIPPAKFYSEQRQLPVVLVERWFKNFDIQDRDPVELTELGRNISFPPLLIEAARGFRAAGQEEKAREILEEILIEYPETLHRAEVEKMLSGLNNNR